MSVAGSSALFRLQLFPYVDGPADFFAAVPQPAVHPPPLAAAQSRQKHAPHTLRSTIAAAVHARARSTTTPSATVAAVHEVDHLTTTQQQQQQWLAAQQDQWLQNQLPNQQFVFPPVEVDVFAGRIVRLGRKVDRHQKAPSISNPLQQAQPNQQNQLSSPLQPPATATQQSLLPATFTTQSPSNAHPPSSATAKTALIPPTTSALATTTTTTTTTKIATSTTAALAATAGTVTPSQVAPSGSPATANRSRSRSFARDAAAAASVVAATESSNCHCYFHENLASIIPSVVGAQQNSASSVAATPLRPATTTHQPLNGLGSDDNTPVVSVMTSPRVSTTTDTSFQISKTQGISGLTSNPLVDTTIPSIEQGNGAPIRGALRTSALTVSTHGQHGSALGLAGAGPPSSSATSAGVTATTATATAPAATTATTGTSSALAGSGSPTPLKRGENTPAKSVYFAANPVTETTVVTTPSVGATSNVVSNRGKKQSNVAYGEEIVDLDLNTGAASVLSGASDSVAYVSGGILPCDCMTDGIPKPSCTCCWSKARPTCCSGIKSLVEPCKHKCIRRAINYVAFKSKVVSRIHAELWVGFDGLLYIKDAGSSSGTFVNRLRLSPANKPSHLFQLNSGDVIQLGVDYQNRTEGIYKCVMIKVFYGLRPTPPTESNTAMMQAALSLLVASANPHADASLYLSAATEALTVEGPTEEARKAKFQAVTGSDMDCVICLYPLSPQQALFLAPCSHCFHFRCAVPLFAAGHLFLCPLCRKVSNLDANVTGGEELNGLYPTPSLLSPEVRSIGPFSGSQLVPTGTQQQQQVLPTLAPAANISSPGALITSSGDGLEAIPEPKDLKEDEDSDSLPRFVNNGKHNIECPKCYEKVDLIVEVPDPLSVEQTAQSDVVSMSGGPFAAGSAPTPNLTRSSGSVYATSDRRSIHSMASSSNYYHVPKVTAREDLEERLSVRSNSVHYNSSVHTDDRRRTTETSDLPGKDIGAVSITQQSSSQSSPLIVGGSNGVSNEAPVLSAGTTTGESQFAVESDSIEYESDREPISDSSSEQHNSIGKAIHDGQRDGSHQPNTDMVVMLTVPSVGSRDDGVGRSSSIGRISSQDVGISPSASQNGVITGSDDESAATSATGGAASSDGKRRIVLKRGTTRVNRRAV